MSDRVAVFIDYQNAYNSARRTFHNPMSDSYTCGQFWPDILGRHLADDAPPGVARHLHKVHVYRGMPDSSRDSKGYGAARKQIAAWESQAGSCLEVHTRPLRYPRGWPDECDPGDRPEEKGIDVQLAIDMAMKASRGEFEVAILMSLDTDLRPALEAVRSLSNPRVRAEVAAWSVPDQHCRRLSLPGARSMYCHWVDEHAYLRMADSRNYTS